MRKSKVLLIVLLCSFFLACGGCSFFNKDPNLTPEQKVNLLKQDYELALPVITLLIDSGVIKDQKVKDAIVFARKEARAFIDEALIQAKAGALNWQFYYEQALAALGRFLQFKTDGEAEARRMGLDLKHLPTTKPVPSTNRVSYPGDYLWNKLSFSLYQQRLS